MASKAGKKKISPLDARLRTVAEPAKGLKFDSNGKFTGINVDDAIQTLTSEDVAFPGHRDILFAGLTAWLINPVPSDNSTVVDAVVLESFRIFAASEAEALGKRTFANVIMSHTNILRDCRQLLEEVYYPLGGASAVRRAYERSANTSELVTKAISKIQFLVQVASILHVHASGLEKNRGEIGQRSYVKAGRLVGKVSFSDGEPLQGRQLSNYWRSHFPSLPLLYAAQVTRIGDCNLLDRIMNSFSESGSRLDYQEVRPHFSEWVARAKYLTHVIFLGMPLAELAKREFPQFKVPQLEVPPPALEPEDLQKVVEGFRPTKPDTTPIRR